MKTIKRFILYGVPKSLLIKIILALVIILIGKNVFAQQIDVSNKIIPSSSGSSGRYYGTEIYNTGTNNLYTINTRYNGQLSKIDFYIRDSDYSFDLNKTYTITLNMATSDWRNNFMGPQVYAANNDGSVSSGTSNWYVSNTFSFVSMKKIKFNIKPTGTIKPLTKFTIYSTNINSTPITGVSNWNLSSIIIDDNTSSGSSSGGSSGGTTTPTPTPNPTFDDTNIINNQNQNTEDIINNQSKNTSDVIENNNQNTQSILDSQNSLNQSVINGIDSVNQQLGTCYKNLFKNIYSIHAFANIYLGNNDIFYQLNPDNPTSSRHLKLQLWGLNGLISESTYHPQLAAGRFYFTFTYYDNITYLTTGINGQNLDTTVKIPLDTLHLDPNSVYTLSYHVSSAVDGYVQFKNFFLVKGNYSGSFIGYDKSLCTSKLDEVSSVIEGSVNGAASGIITNNNSNTNTIVDNQNSNTEDIINNQNSNTDKEIESQKVCNYVDRNNIIDNNKYISNSSGSISNLDNFGVTDFIKINNKSVLTITSNTSYPLNAYFCFYDTNKDLISCSKISDFTTGSDITIPQNAQFFRSSIVYNANRPTFKICKNGNQGITDSISDVNDSINNPNVDSGTGSDFFDSFHTDDNGGISAIVTKPLTIVNNLLSNNNSCSNLPLPEFMGVNNAYLPSGCILWNNAPSTVTSLWNIFVCGFGAYFILKDLFKIIENLKNPDNDRVEVMDL